MLFPQQALPEMAKVTSPDMKKKSSVGQSAASSLKAAQVGCSGNPQSDVAHAM